ncbi:hypothetical protein GOP47_0008722 [Adiantum capillus-veneris]|uniref:DNA-directed RNA polymerase n=1 Tax=Adiantum capillus-veneris TaxID=13818 RepID=A0A9D4ZJZ8_ADICA|nr:hypothetical protein GOP47_0008722 [Adiantum capillus-veneris]
MQDLTKLLHVMALIAKPPPMLSYWKGRRCFQTLGLLLYFQRLASSTMEDALGNDKLMEDVEDFLTDEEEKLFFDKACEFYFAHKSLISHHLDSYNHFLEKDIYRVFEDAPSITIKATHNKSSTQADVMLQSAKIGFGCVTMRKPEWTDQKGNICLLYPTEARLRKMNYSASIYADMNVKIVVTKIDEEDADGGSFYWKREKGKEERTCYTKIAEGEGKVFEKEETVKGAFVGKVPIMVMSDACHFSSLKKDGLIRKSHCLFDGGGYFIINGSEKVVISQEQIAHRMICTAMGKNRGLRCSYRSFTVGEPAYPTHTTTRIVFSNVKSRIPFLTVYFHGLKNAVPAIILFRALGVANDKELVERVCEDADDLEMRELLSYSLYHADKEMGTLVKLARENFSFDPGTRKVIAMQCLQKHIPPEASVQDVLDKYLFPHLKNADSQKVMLLSYMFHCLLACLLGRRKLDNINEFRNKRIELPGDLFKKKLKSFLHQFLKDLQKKLEKLCPHADTFMRQLQFCMDGSILTHGFQRALATGNWDAGRSGVVATLERRNPLYTLSHLRQIRIPVPPVFKQDGKSYINKYAIGRVCMVETPDNENCGVVHTLATGCDISSGSSPDPILDILSHLCTLDMTQIPSSSMKHLTKVFLNGEWVAVHDNPEYMVRHLRNIRQQSYLHKQVEIAANMCQKEIQLFCDSGRFLRPLILLQRNRSHINKKQLNEMSLSGRLVLYPGAMEAMGPEEEESCIVAENYKELQRARNEADGKNYTHCQLHPCFSFSLGSSLIPFFNHNGSYRVMLQAQKHGKQALGIYTSCMRARSDTTSHLLFYPQRPLAETKIVRLSNAPHLSSGQNAIVAICPFWGYNQEDGLVISQASVDRGLFRSCHLWSFDFDMEAKSDQPALKPPCSTESNLPSMPWKLDDDGLPFIGENFLPFDVLARKRGLQENTTTLRLSAVEKGRVDQVIVAADDEENPIARIRLREIRVPVDGDKFSSRHGQKGVIGFLCSQEDMFFSREGIIPDIIINPHAFPSRQSIGQLAEGIVAKIAAVSGRKVDASAFNKVEIQTMLDELKRFVFCQQAFLTL